VAKLWLNLKLFKLKSLMDFDESNEFSDKRSQTDFDDVEESF